MHLGSLYTAAASYLDARASRGRWLLRIEDLDPPREVPGAAQRIVATLASFGFEWDGPILRQSARRTAYEEALALLRTRDLLFECSCSRTVLGPSTRYPGTCRERPASPGVATATRLRVEPGEIRFVDRVQGAQVEDVAHALGDLLLKRRDGLYAYLLAVVVDDADQGVSDVVRGADLIEHTAAQIHLQRVLGLSTPRYAHPPALVEPSGAKLAKSARSVALDARAGAAALARVFALLGLDPPRELARGTLAAAWEWAIGAWRIESVPRALTLRVPNH